MKALIGSKFDVRSFEDTNRVFEFDHLQMNTFEFVRCSKNDVRVRSMFDKKVFDSSLKIDKVGNTATVTQARIFILGFCTYITKLCRYDLLAISHSTKYS